MLFRSILDGFPRTVVQAEAFEKMGGKIDAVLNLEIADEEITKRMAGRRVCKDCGTPFHMEFNPPKEHGKCDLCLGELITRKDDDSQTVKNRLQVYHEQTEPLVAFYNTRGNIVRIDALAGPKTITDQALKAIGAQ